MGRGVRLWGAVWLLAILLVCGLSSPVPAADEGEPAEAGAAEAPAEMAPAPAEGPAPGFYVSAGWLIASVLAVLLWLGLLDWMAKDATRVGTSENFWNSLMLAAGVAGFVLVIFVNAVFVVTVYVGVIALFGMYVWTRNQMVASDQRVFTVDHLAFVASAVLAKAGIHVSATALAGRQEDRTQIILVRKDGKSLDAISEEHRGTVETSESVLAVKEMIENAVNARATDIHIEPKQDQVQVRYRIDGILHGVPSYSAELGPAMVSVLKVLSDMDIAERRKPQDGTFAGKLGERTLDFRSATSSAVHGETMSLRILDRDRDLIRLENLGMSAGVKERLVRVINQPHGLLIACGPTGAGKTTTLYAALSELDAYQKNIMTIENPIEYRLDNITQTAVNLRAGVTFAGTLRSLLRQDPDVIMVGEIRDAETARTALQAAMTGHFVFTTVHANDCITALFRLLDLGVEAYLVGSSLTAVVAQRLVRVLCEHCKVPYVPKQDFLRKIGMDPARVQQFWKAQGCEECQGTGYYGRTGLYELFLMNDRIRDLVRGSPSVQLLKAEARKAGLRTLVEDGLIKVAQGLTSIKELMRVTK